MKKILLFAAAAMMVSVCMLSCKKNNQQEEQPKEKMVAEAPKHAEDAVSFTFKTENMTADEQEAAAVTIEKYKVLPEKAVFTEAGQYVFKGKILAVVKADLGVGDTYTKTGDYSVGEDGSYQMPGIGTISTEESGSGEQDTTITTEDGEESTIPATVQDAPPASGENENNMVRSWVPEGKVKIEIPSKGYNTNLEPDLQAIADYLKEHNVNINPDEYKGYVISSITLSLADNSFIIAFQNNQAYLGNWKWTDQANGKFSYEFSDKWGSEMISGKASGTVTFFSENSVNKCSFVMSINAKGETANLEFVLKEKK